MLVDNGSLAGLEDIIRNDAQLREASYYYRHDVKQEDEKPSLERLIHFVK